MQKRILIKLSGEALSQHDDNNNITSPYNFDHVNHIASILSKANKKDVQICLVIGGGNIWRGRQANSKMQASTADQMGMLSTMLNALCMADALKQQGEKVLIQSAYSLETFTEGFDINKGEQALEENKIVIFALGLGHPFFTTDTAVVLRARQMQVNEILMAKNIDGIYSADPNKDKNAKFIEDISYSEALQQNLRVMDQSAFAMLMESKIEKVRVFSLNNAENILKILDGEKLGTILHA